VIIVERIHVRIYTSGEEWRGEERRGKAFTSMVNKIRGWGMGVISVLCAGNRG